MDKRDILNRSRQSGHDEGVEHMEDKGRKLGAYAFYSLFLFLLLFNFFLGKNNSAVFYAISSLFWAFFAAEAFPKYQFSRKRSYLVTAIAGALASVAYVLNFVITTLRQ